MGSSINIGHRYLLPVYGFLYAWIAAMIARTRRVGLAACIIAVALIAAESLSAYPHYLAFFNVLSGGSRNGPRYLVDSNIDWGQDLLKLRNYLQESPAPCVALRYFGAADLKYYGMDLPPVEPVLESGTRCLGAVSVTALQMTPELAPLRSCEPRARIGYSINIYDLNSPTCPVTRPITQ
jgi:hypothetical protein